MEFQVIADRATQIADLYDQLTEKKYGVRWTPQDRMAGFVGDVGQLSKIIMAKHGLRDMEDVNSKLTHELSDCLWSVLVLAKAYNIDLPTEFMKTMDELEERIASGRT